MLVELSTWYKQFWFIHEQILGHFATSKLFSLCASQSKTSLCSRSIANPAVGLVVNNGSVVWECVNISTEFNLATEAWELRHPGVDRRLRHTLAPAGFFTAPDNLSQCSAQIISWSPSPDNLFPQGWVSSNYWPDLHRPLHSLGTWLDDCNLHRQAYHIRRPEGRMQKKKASWPKW